MIKECRHNLTACLENFTRGQSENVRWKPNESSSGSCSEAETETQMEMEKAETETETETAAHSSTCECEREFLCVSLYVCMRVCECMREGLSYCVGYSRFA